MAWSVGAVWKRLGVGGRRHAGEARAPRRQVRAALGDNGGGGVPRYSANEPSAAAATSTPWRVTSTTVRARPGRRRALGIFRRRSVLRGEFVWVRRALNSQSDGCAANAAIRVSTKMENTADSGGANTGFRCARTLEAKAPPAPGLGTRPRDPPCTVTLADLPPSRNCAPAPGAPHTRARASRRAGTHSADARWAAQVQKKMEKKAEAKTEAGMSSAGSKKKKDKKAKARAPTKRMDL